MAPLAGKPPFATDEPDSYYEVPQAQPRLRQPKPADPNARTSAYDVYNNYLAEDSANLAVPKSDASSRNSGIGAMLLNMGDDSDDDSDDEDVYHRRPTAPPGIIAPLSKNAALAAATGASAPPSPTRSNPPRQAQPSAPMSQPQRMPQPQPMGQGAQNLSQMPQQMPQPIAAPRPGYPAPMAALNLARPEPAMPKTSLAPIQIPNADVFKGSAFPMPASPAPSAPHPLQPPMTPITAAFIRPSKSPVGGVVNVSFTGLSEEGKATPRKPIMRGNSEETMLPSRGEKGDDFWRRFSMVVKEETKKGKGGKKDSSWLDQTLNRSKSYSRWVWFGGLFLLLVIAGGIGVGVWATRNNPGHQQPTAIGGSADNLVTSVVSSSTAGVAAAGKSTSLHVSPTNTVARREARAIPTHLIARHKHLKNREASAW